MLILGGAGETALCCPGGERRRGERRRGRAAGPALPPPGNGARGLRRPLPRPDLTRPAERAAPRRPATGRGEAQQEVSSGSWVKVLGQERAAGGSARRS